MKFVFTIAAAFLVALVSSTPSLRSASVQAAGCEMMCLDVYDPVCGSDGKTYSNKCQLNLADCNNRYANPGAKAISVATTGKCASEAEAVQCPRGCPKIMMPVCGSNGVTYNNECEFENAKCTLKIASMALTMTRGACADAEKAAPTPAPSTLRKCAQMCTEDYAPVCGSDGQTYSNKCFFNVAKCNLGSKGTLTMVSEGECKTVGDSDGQVEDAVACPHGCPKIMMPVCGSDGVTYNNECEFQNAKCTLKIAGWAMTFTPGRCA